jgi:predicted site-specific integrase-resolvase
MAMNQRTPVHSETFTLQELAQRMGISLTVAHELARRDDLPVSIIRVGRRYLFSERAYEALMNRQHAPKADDAA